METLIKAKGLGFKYGSDCHYLFQNLNFEIRKGEVLCLTGRSGVGKSTLLRIIAKILEPSEGKVLYAGKESNQAIGFVFQDARLLPWRTAYSNVAFSIENLRLSKSEIHSRIIRALSLVGILGHKNKYPSQLSGGQQQRVSLARALVTKSPLLLLDEPFSGLDGETKEEICLILKNLIRDEYLAVVFVTHDPEDIEYFGGAKIEIGKELIKPLLPHQTLQAPRYQNRNIR